MIVAGAIAGAATLFPVDRSLVVRVYLLFVGGLALKELVAAAVYPLPRQPRRPLRTPGRSRKARPEALALLEDRVALASQTAADLHFRLRPVLLEIAAERAAGRPGGKLDEELAGDAWQLLRPELGAPADPFGPGYAPARLAAVVAAIEEI